MELKKGISDCEGEDMFKKEMLKITILKYDEVSLSFMDKKVQI
ncbi:hypothetical protein bcere0004_42740 [Bacillus cereus BGSC 6E1]|nr:hypothetical protein bcere0004_42740 [Bacillus cereus BGSC 6E1]